MYLLFTDILNRIEHEDKKLKAKAVQSLIVNDMAQLNIDKRFIEQNEHEEDDIDKIMVMIDHSSKPQLGEEKLPDCTLA